MDTRLLRPARSGSAFFVFVKTKHIQLNGHPPTATGPVRIGVFVKTKHMQSNRQPTTARGPARPRRTRLTRHRQSPQEPTEAGPVAVVGCLFDRLHFDISRKAGRITLLHGFLYLPRDFCHSPKELTTVQIVVFGDERNLVGGDCNFTTYRCCNGRRTLAPLIKAYMITMLVRILNFARRAEFGRAENKGISRSRPSKVCPRHTFPGKADRRYCGPKSLNKGSIAVLFAEG
ncbi:hypothetical protein J6590_080086 [Homalodisca vitripennis]|nr:hypothetical protein J6590_080086 [Homalodisca vitripennis]